jgi:hypothetical protein
MRSVIDAALSLAGGALEAALVITLVRRGFWRRMFPFFFSYICYALANVVVLLLSAALTTNRRTYFTIYGVMQAIYAILAVLAMNEAFHRIFKPYYFRRSWFRLLVPTAVLAILSLSLWNSVRHRPIQAGPLTIIYISLDLASNYMLAGIFGLFGFLVFFWRTKWLEPPFGIMLGFGVFSVVGMMADALRSEFGIKMNLVFSYASAVAYIIACVVWLQAFRERHDDPGNRPGSSADPSELLQLLDRPTEMLERTRNIKRCQ